MSPRTAAISPASEKEIAANGQPLLHPCRVRRTRPLVRAIYRGLPDVKTARGDASGLVRVNRNDLFIEGNNLTRSLL